MTSTTDGHGNGSPLEAVRSLLDQGKHGTVIRKLRSLLKTTPEDTAARYLLGIACFESGQLEAAVAAFEQAWAERSDIPELRTNYGAALARVGRLDDAIRLLGEAMQNNPDDRAACDNLIQAHLEMGDHEWALAECERRIQRYPDDPDGYFLRGNIQLVLGGVRDAAEDFRRAVTQDPDEPRYQYNYGFACYLAGQTKEAEAAFARFYRADRRTAAHYSYGNSQTLFRRARAASLQARRLRTGAAQGAIIGVSPQMQDLFEMLERVAPRDVTVLIRGESGTGKELFAEALHKGSARKDRDFIALNVAAVPDELIESELFGHKKGIFTGATEDRPGLFETASGGTLFLDEISEMSVRAQAKVLRALEERKIRRLGERREIPIDVRLVTATNQNLVRLVESGDFRADLYHRLKVIELYIPPLRERPEDIAPLAAHFLDQHAKRHRISIHGIVPEAAERLESYGWSGNVRELRNAVEHAVIMARGESVTEEDLPAEVVPENRCQGHTPKALPDSPETEKASILTALELCRWHRGKAAEQLGISRRHFYRLMEKHGIGVKDG
jgi:DNA-binding NtrC family response regulator/Flp pilus assembly protein TadD